MNALIAIIERKLTAAIQERHNLLLDGNITTSYSNGEIAALTDILYNAYRENGMSARFAYSKANEFVADATKNVRY